MQRSSFMSVITGFLLLASAGVATQTAAARRPQDPPPRVTFAETIAPIVFANCSSCHRPGEAAPFSLLSYEDVARRGALIAQVTASRYMPPWHAAAGYGEFVDERRLTDAQIAAIARWVKDGMPRGDMRRMPALPPFPPDGWRLGQPDLVLQMPAFDVPADGPDVFRNFVLPTGLTEDKWVRAIEYRPSARAVVHHAVFSAVAGGSLAARDGRDGRPGFGGLSAVGLIGGGGEGARGLGGWAVGGGPLVRPEGVADKLPKASDFLLQLHLHPSGKPETERSLVGIYFADRAPQKELFSLEVPALFGLGAGLDIPAGAKEYTIRESATVPADIKVFSTSAHAHYLAREMKATATLPDGTVRPLLWITDWDFNWQDSYVFKTPFVLPKGTRIDTTVTYDNSADNPRNPVSPPRRVRFGEQSLDEMGAVEISFQVVNDADADAVRQATALRFKQTIAAAGKEGTLGRFLARNKAARQPMQQLTIFDRSGGVVTRVGEAGAYSQAAFSPDGSRLVVIKGDPDTGAQDVWTLDIATGKSRALTADDALDSAPVWSPDGAYIAYVSQRDDAYRIYRRRADGSGAEELLYRHPTATPLIVLTDWSADGRHLTFWQGDQMFLLPVDGDRIAVPLDQKLFFGRGGRLSPDGRFLAYNSNQSGRFDVYVRPLTFGAAGSDAAAEARRISDGGVGGIVWRRDGKEIFYLAQPGQIVTAVDVNTVGGIESGTPRPLFKLPTPILAVAQLSSVASPDGQRFVFAVNVTQFKAP